MGGGVNAGKSTNAGTPLLRRSRGGGREVPSKKIVEREWRLPERERGGRGAFWFTGKQVYRHPKGPANTETALTGPGDNQWRGVFPGSLGRVPKKGRGRGTEGAAYQGQVSGVQERKGGQVCRTRQEKLDKHVQLVKGGRPFNHGARKETNRRGSKGMESPRMHVRIGNMEEKPRERKIARKRSFRKGPYREARVHSRKRKTRGGQRLTGNRARPEVKQKREKRGKDWKPTRGGPARCPSPRTLAAIGHQKRAPSSRQRRQQQKNTTQRLTFKWPGDALLVRWVDDKRAGRSSRESVEKKSA